MRILISTWGWRSHFYCLVPVAWALQTAGHEVLVATQPGLAPVVDEAGLVAVPLGPNLDFEAVFTDRIGKIGGSTGDGRPDPDGPAITPDGGVVHMADAWVDDLVAFGRSFRPDLVLWEPFNLAAAVAAAVLDVPGAQVLWGPDHGSTLAWDHEGVFGPLARRFGITSSDVRVAGGLMIDPVPAPLQVPLPVPSLPMRYLPYNGTHVLPPWLHEPPSRPRVCVTGGTVAGPGLSERADLADVVRAVADLGADVVVAVAKAHRDALPPLPDTVRVADTPLALRLVLPGSAAFVQHGGAGTMMTALVCGVPQLVLPQVGDEHFNAERLLLSGAGLVLEEPDIASVRDSVAALMDGGPWREAAELLRDRIHAMPTPAQVVDQLVAYAEGARP
ncbi:nucleotide disphospho-sugar-binding domain-containing protein [Saccharothrix sp.]|uniref:nucleotide disphospho-sugar-binding domain-containing protein n=1 Tax=Saccharothrix sp. TaxID=1873460 RepID=UPI00281202DA|nr:nucleotide disphospho-sugar-binding domain-containing protein [Saccharothrix sp.]